MSAQLMDQPKGQRRMISPASLDRAAHDAYEGSTFFDGPWACLPAANQARWRQTVLTVAANRVTPAPWSFADLTDKQAAVLDAIAAGLLQREIAAEMGVGMSAVSNHLQAVLARTGCRDRAELLDRYQAWRDEREVAA
jgi:DNA-binding NarL/FixJ family response regulator